MTSSEAAKVPWWKYRRPEDRAGPLTWREKFNGAMVAQPPPRLALPSQVENALGRLFFVLYVIVSWLIGIGAFLVAWFYSIERYGFFLGVGLGWIPSACIGVFAGVLWPLVLLVYLKWPDLLGKLTP